MNSSNHSTPQRNYLEECVIEDPAIEEFLKLIGRRRFNSLSNQVERVRVKLENSDDSDDQAYWNLDVHFPVEDALGALEYFKAIAKMTFGKRLYDMCTRIEQAIKET